MSLADRLADQPRQARQCVITRTLASLPERDRTAVLDALAAGVGIEKIAAEMTADGFRTSATSLARHQNGRCCCESR